MQCTTECRLGLQRFRYLAMAAAILALLAPSWSNAWGLEAPDTATSTTAAVVAPAAAISESFQHVLDGAAPSGVADLKAMQLHVQKLNERLTKSVVGIQVGQAQGSGVIISKDGYILTAAHVAGSPNHDNVTFILSDGREVHGKTLGMYRTLDAGLMKITDAGDYPFAEMAAPDSIKEGEWCLALGHPGGYDKDRGVVLRLGRVVVLSNEAITTDCTLVGGDSGGPLFDLEGRVIGINSRIAEMLTANIHVPVSAFKDSWDRLVAGEAWGYLPGRRPYLGVKGEENATEAKIASVDPGSPAERGGLQAGDVILRFGGKDINNFKSLVDAVSERQPSRERIAVVIRRGEEEKELRLQVRSRD